MAARNLAEFVDFMGEAGNAEAGQFAHELVDPLAKLRLCLHQRILGNPHLLHS